VSIHKWPFLSWSAFSAGFRLRRTDVRLAANPCSALIRTEIAHFWIGHYWYYIPQCSEEYYRLTQTLFNRYFFWDEGLMTNEQLRRLFNISHSTISHSVKIFKPKMINDKKVKNQFDKFNSQFQVWKQYHSIFKLSILLTLK
jgi:hypothetical protein